MIVSAGVNVEVTFSAKVAGVAETVTVDAETPVIDSKKMGTGTTVSQEELAKLPNSRDPWAFMRTVPGVQIDRVNQAGSESGQQSGFIGKGSSQTDAMWVLDGVVITDPAAVGASPTYFDFDAFEEVAITTGGADVRVATGGVGINLVTKRGTNAFHGGVSGFYASEKLEASNLPSELEGDPRLQGSDKADHAEQIAEYGAELGGPILKDKLWFWGSYGKQDLRIQRLNQTQDKTLLKDYNAKLNWQVSSSNMFSAFWFLGEKIKLGRPNTRGLGTETASHTRDQGGVYSDDSWPQGFLKIEDNHVFSPSFMLNVKAVALQPGLRARAAGRPRPERGPRPRELDRLRLVQAVPVGAAVGHAQRRRQLLPRQPRVQVRLRLPAGDDEQLEPRPGQRHRGPHRDRARQDRPHPARAGLGVQGRLHLALPAGHLHLGPPDGHGRPALGPAEGRERRLHRHRQPALPGDPARPRLRRRRHQDRVERHLAARGLHLRARRRRARRCCAATSRSSPSSSPTPT